MASNLPQPAAALGVEPIAAAASRIEQIRGKALELFAGRGFAQVGMRELALHVGITAGSLYHHFVSKEQLLFELLEEFYEDLHELVELSETGTPMQRLQRLQALLQSHIALHERCRLHARMAEQELRCLSPAHQQQIRQLRSSYEDKLLLHVQALGVRAPTTLLRACVQGLLAWLNCVPNWSADCGLPAGQKQALVNAMALGALAAVLKQPGDDACGVPLWPAAAARQH